jgi:ribonucleotide reductase alpha subunit
LFVYTGEFVCVSRHLLQDLIELGIWNLELKQKIVANNGSIQSIDEIPSHIKALYKTVWEISQRLIIDMAADRGAFIDQSQSLNIHMRDVTIAKLTSMHFHAWKKGLKTGMYYLRTKPSTDAIKFTVDPDLIKQQEAENLIFKQQQQQLDNDPEKHAKEMKEKLRIAKAKCAEGSPEGECLLCSS